MRDPIRRDLLVGRSAVETELLQRLFAKIHRHPMHHALSGRHPFEQRQGRTRIAIHKMERVAMNRFDVVGGIRLNRLLEVSLGTWPVELRQTVGVVNERDIVFAGSCVARYLQDSLERAIERRWN